MRRDRPKLAITRRRFAGLAISSAVILAACGGSSVSSPSEDDPAASPVLSGVVREPAPVVDATTLPSLTDPGTDVAFRAEPGGIQVVYFGFTNCPDVCPTTMSDFRAALNRLERDEEGSTDLVDTVVVTVDPARDLDVMAQYASSFVDGAVAAGTMDEDLLLAAAEPFGVSYDVRTLDDGTIEVDHSPFLYAVDDQGRLVLTWQFGATPTDLANDLDILLDRASA
jgi:protein SCO1/2